MNLITSDLRTIATLIKARYLKTIKVEDGKIIELYRSPTKEEMSQAKDEFGDVRGVLLGKDLVIWTSDLRNEEKGFLVTGFMPSKHSIEHSSVVKVMGWTNFIPLLFSVPHKTVELSTWSIHSTESNIKAMEDKVQTNEHIKSLDYILTPFKL